MDRRHPSEGGEVVAPFEGRDDPARARFARKRQYFPRRPSVVVVDEREPGQGIVDVGVEARRDHDEIGREGLERRQDLARHRVAERLAARAGGERRVDDVADPGLLAGAGARVVRPLMGRGVKQAGVALEHVLGAVAVMDVEVDHRDPLKPMDGAGVKRADGDVVEQAEAHRPRGLGVVAGRADGAKGVGGLARGHRIDRGADRACRAQRRFARARRERRVGIEVHTPGCRNARQHHFDISGRVRALERLACGLRGLAPVEGGELRGVERIEHRAQPGRAFGMKRPGIVFETGRMGE